MPPKFVLKESTLLQILSYNTLSRLIDDKTRASEIESFESNIFHVQQFLPQNERPAMYCFVSHTTPQYSVIDWLRDTLLHIVSLDGLLAVGSVM